jgi:phosphoglycolate phosphatase-like HAD superfamily hydrolase
MKGNAIIWDFDGTLVDSRQKNLSVNRALIAHVTGKPADSFPLLRSQEQFEAADARSSNWREFYLQDFGMSEEETAEAGRLWTEFQLQDKTPMPLFPGIGEAIATLGDLPQGIVSQNSRDMIQATMTQAGLERHIGAIIGYEEVPLDQQKPAPAGLLACLEKLTQLRPGMVFYIGDWQTDALQAVKARQVIQGRALAITLISIGAFYSGTAADDAWTTRFDISVQHPGEIVQIVRDKAGRKGTLPGSQ